MENIPLHICVLCVSTNVHLRYMYMHTSYCLTRDVNEEAGPHSMEVLQACRVPWCCDHFGV